MKLSVTLAPRELIAGASYMDAIQILIETLGGVKPTLSKLEKLSLLCGKEIKRNEKLYTYSISKSKGLILHVDLPEDLTIDILKLYADVFIMLTPLIDTTVANIIAIKKVIDNKALIIQKTYKDLM